MHAQDASDPAGDAIANLPASDDPTHVRSTSGRAATTSRRRRSIASLRYSRSARVRARRLLERLRLAPSEFLSGSRLAGRLSSFMGLLAGDQRLDVLEPEAVPALGAKAYGREITVRDELPNSAGVDAENVGNLFRAK
jgi:hypothetical protein